MSVPSVMSGQAPDLCIIKSWVMLIVFKIQIPLDQLPYELKAELSGDGV